MVVAINPLTLEELKVVLAEDFNEEDSLTIASSITKPIGIKQLLMVLEMAKSENSVITPERMIECLQTCGF